MVEFSIEDLEGAPQATPQIAPPRGGTFTIEDLEGAIPQAPQVPLAGLEPGEQPIAPPQGLPLAANIGSGINRGLANTLGLPVDLITAGINTLTRTAKRQLEQSPLGQTILSGPVGGALEGITEPFGGSVELEELFKDFGLVVDPQTRKGRIIQRVGEEIGAAAVPLGALGATARGVQPITKGITAPLRESIRRAPGTAAALETTAATGAGVAAGLAQEAFPASPGVEIGAQLVGGAAGSFLPLRAIGQGVRTIKGTFGEAARNNFAKTRARKTLEANIADPVEVERILVAQGDDTDSLLTTAQLTDDPGLVALEQQFAKNSAQFNDKIQGISATNQAQIEADIDGIFDGAIEESLKIARKDTPRGATQDQRAALVRESLVNQKDIANAEVSALFDAVDPDDIVVVDVTDIKTAANDISRLTTKSDNPSDIPQDLVDIVDSLGKPPETTLILPPGTRQAPSALEKFNEVRALRSRILNDVRSESKQLAPNRRKIAKLRVLQRSVDKTLKRFGDLDEGAFDVATNKSIVDYRKAAAARNEFSQKFEQGTVAKLLQPGVRGEQFRIAESETINSILSGRRGQKEALEQLNVAFGDDQGARIAIQEFLGESLIDTAEDVLGARKPQNMVKFIDKNRRVFENFLGKEQADSLEQMSKELVRVAQRVKPSAKRPTVPKRIFKASTIWSRALAVKRGQVGPTFLAGEASTRIIGGIMDRMTTEQTDTLLKAALIDPEIARDLITVVGPKNSDALARRLRGHLINLFGTEAEQQEREQRLQELRAPTPQVSEEDMRLIQENNLTPEEIEGILGFIPEGL